MIKRRHDHAVLLMLTAISKSSRGTDYAHSDARNVDDTSPVVAASHRPGVPRKFPACILPLAEQSSHPDILLVSMPAGRITGRTTPVTPRMRERSRIDIIEVKYAYDLTVHSEVRRAIKQHRPLKRALLRAGWGSVTIHPFIIGSAGTIRHKCHRVLKVCGITDADARTRLLETIAIDSIRRTADIIRVRTRNLASVPAAPALVTPAQQEPPSQQSDGPSPDPPHANSLTDEAGPSESSAHADSVSAQPQETAGGPSAANQQTRQGKRAATAAQSGASRNKRHRPAAQASTASPRTGNPTTAQKRQMRQTPVPPPNAMAEPSLHPLRKRMRCLSNVVQPATEHMLSYPGDLPAQQCQAQSTVPQACVPTLLTGRPRRSPRLVRSSSGPAPPADAVLYLERAQRKRRPPPPRLDPSHQPKRLRTRAATSSPTPDCSVTGATSPLMPEASNCDARRHMPFDNG